MSFSDVFKSTFLENISTLSGVDVLLALGLSFVLGLFIFIVYKKTYRGVMYSDSFGVSLIAMAMVTSLVIIAVSSNVVLSLGMVGALSIVRFRTAIKEPMDIAFLFWAIAVGIVLGAGLVSLALIGSSLIGIIIILFSTRRSADTPYILVFDCENEAAETVATKIISDMAKKSLLKVKTVYKEKIELTYEVRVRDSASELAKCLSEENGICNVSLVSYNGEYMA